MRNLISLILLLFYTIVSAQSIEIEVDRDSIVIGDVITLSYKFNDLEKVGIESIDFSMLNEVENFLYGRDSTFYEEKVKIEFLGVNELGLQNQNLKISTEKIESGKTYHIKAAIYDVGIFAIPMPSVSRQGSIVSVPKIKQKIIYVMPPVGMEVLDSLDIQPIKDIIREPVRWTDYLIYLYYVLGLCFLAGLFLFIIKKVGRSEVKNPEVVMIEEVKEEADIIAIRALKKLQNESLWQNDQEKEYHSRLTKVIKRYLEDRYESSALESTTTQIAIDLRKHNIGESLIKDVENILNISDIVKFAKGEAGPQINTEFLEKAYNFVEKTRKIVS